MLRECAVSSFLPSSSSFHSSSRSRCTPNDVYNRCNKNKINIMMADDGAAVKGALENLLSYADEGVGNNKISYEMIRGLLLEPADQSSYFENSYSHDKNYVVSNHQDENPSTTALYHQLRGLPKRPLYKEISRRLRTIRQYSDRQKDEDDEKLPLPCFLPASHFDLTEICSLNELIPPPPSISMDIDECTRWIQIAGQDGIYSILGCRRTIGTIQLLSPSTTTPSYLLPPTIPQLLEASRQLYKPHTKSSLTVAARALAKHAHRGEEQFFGVLKGGEAQKNEHADRVIQRLIDEAMWVNIHCFGGIDESNPVVEIRTYGGYGARWSGVWDSDVFSLVDVEFRGFLEPQVCTLCLCLSLVCPLTCSL